MVEVSRFCARQVPTNYPDRDPEEGPENLLTCAMLMHKGFLTLCPYESEKDACTCTSYKSPNSSE